MPGEALLEKMQVSTSAKVFTTGPLQMFSSELVLRFDIIAWYESLSEPQKRLLVEKSSAKVCPTSETTETTNFKLRINY